MSAQPVSGFARGLTTVAPSEQPLETDIQPATPAPPPAPSTAVVVWTPPPEPGVWERFKWRLFGRPDPGLDGRFDHVIIDPSLISVPKDERLARQILKLGKAGELSVKRLYESLGSDGIAIATPKSVDAVRKDMRIAAERLEQRSPAAKLADAARLQLEGLRRELDSLDHLRSDGTLLQRKTDAGITSLFASFDGQQVELQTLLTGAANAVGGEQEKVELLRTGLAGLVARRDAMIPAIEQQLEAYRASADQRRELEAQANREQEARVAVITGLSSAERTSYVDRLGRATKLGARFYAPDGGHVSSGDVLAHLAWHGVDMTLGGAGMARFRSLFGPPKEEQRHAIRDLTGLEDMLKRLGIGR